MTGHPDLLTPEWLTRQLVTLLGQASSGSDPDHQACAKYADLLWKMMPKGRRDASTQSSELVASVRQALSEAHGIQVEET